METTFKKFSDLYANSTIIIDERIQRKYEWESSKIMGLVDSINESALSYNEDFARNECKKDIGTMLAFEVPNNELKPNVKLGYYADEGNQRLVSHAIIAKAIQMSAKMYSLDNDNMTILTSENEVMLNRLIKDIKRNLIPESQRDVFEYIMDLEEDRPTRYTNTRIVKNYIVTYESYLTVIDNNLEGFNIIVDFFINTLGCNMTYYRPTTLLIRQEKYNALNTAVKEQSKLHRAFSNLNEAASRVGYDNFANDVHHYECLVKKTKGLNPENIFSLYYYIKCVNQMGEHGDIKAPINELTQKLSLLNLYTYDFFKNFFNEFGIFCNLFTKKIKWVAMDTIENRRVATLLSCIIDFFNRSPRQATSAYFFKLLINCFDIENNCLINGTKATIDKSMLIKLLTQIFIYKICIDCYAANNSANDERSVYTPLIKESKELTNDTLVEHYYRLKKVVDASIVTPMYNDVLYKLKYKSKGLRPILCIIKAEGNTFDEILRQYNNIYYDFNGYDIDHNILQASGGGDEVANLRLEPKADNRRENSFEGNYRYIGNDTSFPEHMRNKFFTENDIPERYKWMTKKVHDFIDNLLVY